jgi:predicted DNA-binding mobile mystery protein A
MSRPSCSHSSTEKFSLLIPDDVSSTSSYALQDPQATVLYRMKHHRSRARRALQARVAGLGERLGVPLPGGWVKTVREALGMSSYQLAGRIGLSPTRVRQLEAEEVAGSIRLATLRRIAEAMHCRLVYGLVPTEPLEDIVLRQAYLKAATLLCVWGPHHPSAGDPDLVPATRIEELEDLTMHFVDHRDLWL